MTTMLKAEGLVKRFGGLAANDGVSLDVAEGSIHGLIGPNGAGKSTAINLLSGEARPDEGSVVFAGTDITALPPHARAERGLQRSYQVASLFHEFTALDHIALALQTRAGHSFRFFTAARRDASLRDPAHARLAALGLEGLAERRIADIAHGERRQVELAMVLATDPTMLLLDEPMAGMGRTEREAMVTTLGALKGKVTILLVEHDMDVVFALADIITVMVKGQPIATGDPATIRADAAVRTAYLGDMA